MGATAIFVSLVQQSIKIVLLTRTEAGCDYVSIYTDETMTVGYGEAKYTGGKGGHPGNWPGMDGRPALIILASSFFFVWMTDGSVEFLEPQASSA